ncbi:MAG: GAF domain-containing protein [Anaerolineales bacterium]|nr:GAF domain-containing protein [Anaerolineales bacterium]
MSSPLDPPPADAVPAVDWPTTLGILRDAGSRINQLGPETSLPEALQLIAETALRLLGADPTDRASAVIYTYDAARDAFDPASRVSAGEGAGPLTGDSPRPGGMGFTALQRRARVLSYEEQGLSFHPLKYLAGMRTSACYPLLVGRHPVGALYISLYSARHFSAEELLVLDAFVHLAAVAIYNTRQFEGMHRALQRKIEALERLQRADRLISSRRNLGDTLREILNMALNLTGAELGSFRLLDKATGRLRLVALVGAVPDQRRGNLPPEETSGVVGYVASRRQAVRIDDLHQPPWNEIYHPLTERRVMRSELAVPLLGSGDGLEGVVNVESPHLAHFDAEAQTVLESLATQATIALLEARLLDTIEEVTDRMVGHPPDVVFGLVLDRICDLLNLAHAAVWELESADGDMLRLRACHGDFPPGYRVPVVGSLLGRAVLTRQPVVSLDLAGDPRLGRRHLAHRMGWDAALIVPLLMRDGRPRGALGVYAPKPRTFSDWDTRLLSLLANHAALALQLGEALDQARLAEERQAVAETFAVLGDISANLLHRVNNLIGAIPVKVQGLTSKRPALLEDRYVAERLAEIEAGARGAMDVARETVSYLRPVKLTPTPVAECFAGVAARLALPPHVTLAAEGLERLPPVLAGAEALRLVFFNLLENALDALGERPGHVHVTGRVTTDTLDAGREWVEVTVADNGPGVPPEVREQIFDPNFSTKASAKQLGFGLWWVKTWVQRCGGSITLAAPNQADPDRPGCAFVIRLPLAPPPTDEARA